ncbi:MAG: SEC-C domain-containing protein [Clostridia bacterium]|nr:SEC-C domain-containing protein [Clostridia bacterium]
MITSIRDDTARMIMSIIPKPTQEIKRVEVAKPVSEGFAGGGPKAVKRPIRVDKTQKVGRNDPCPCGSGKKYKNCHGRPQNNGAGAGE